MIKTQFPAWLNLQLKIEDGFLRVTSPDLPGLHLCSKDHEAVMGDVMPAIWFLLDKSIPEAPE